MSVTRYTLTGVSLDNFAGGVCTSQLVSILIAHHQPVNNNSALLARPTGSAGRDEYPI
jgi:hypothetical protein